MTEGLTEDQKRKIEEEERYREGVKSQLSKNFHVPKKRSGCFWIFVIFGILVLMGMVISASSGSSNTSDSGSTPTDSQEDLVGNVNFDGTQFHIINQEDKDWTSCRFTLNSDYRYPPEMGLLGAETKVVGTIEAGSTYNVGAGQFVLKGGTRFNPFSTQAQDFSASCKGRFGYWKWD